MCVSAAFPTRPSPLLKVRSSETILTVDKEKCVVESGGGLRRMLDLSIQGIASILGECDIILLDSTVTLVEFSLKEEVGD